MVFLKNECKVCLNQRKLLITYVLDSYIECDLN
jgi:hypothetical protein